MCNILEVNGFAYNNIFMYFVCSITEVQRDVEYRVTFSAGNSTVFLNMYGQTVFLAYFILSSSFSI